MVFVNTKRLIADDIEEDFGRENLMGHLRELVDRAST